MVKAPTVEDIPNHFYKYRSLDKASKAYTLDILLNNRLYWPSPLSFNDPFDCMPCYVNEGSRLKREASFRRLINEKLSHLPKSERKSFLAQSLRVSPQDFQTLMHDGQRHTMSETGVCCLSTNPDNILMWTHYADAHKGLCLRFTPISKSGKDFDSRLAHFEFAYPVKYSKNRPVINVLEKYGDDHLELALLTKADFWAYEAEWRMIGYREGPGLYEFPAICLDAIIFGARTSSDDHQEILALAKSRQYPVKIYKTEFDASQFRMHIIELE